MQLLRKLIAPVFIETKSYDNKTTSITSRNSKLYKQHYRTTLLKPLVL